MFDLFWPVLAIIFAAILYGWYEYRSDNRDIHEGNLTETQFRLWTVSASGLLLFLSGYYIAKGADNAFMCSIFGLVAFFLAITFAMPKNKENK